MLINGLTQLPRHQIRAIILSSDAAIAYLALAIAGLLLSSAGADDPLGTLPVWQLGAYGLSAPAIFIALRLPLIKLSALSARDLMRIVYASILLAAFVAASLWVAKNPAAGVMAWLVGALFFVGAVTSRVAALAALEHLRELRARRTPVAVFGAGGKGIQVATALLQSPTERLAVFFDDNPALHGMAVGGVPVLSPVGMVDELKRRGISSLIVALPKSGAAREKAVVRACKSTGVQVRIVPSYVDMLVDRAGFGHLKTVLPDDILGRDNVALDTPEISQSYAGKAVMVTGAGGSIGSELCRQLLHCKPSKIVLFEASEFNLYEVERALRDLVGHDGPAIVATLGSVVDARRTAQVMQDEKVQIVLHAAAYKHVPMVETNEVEGARNNVIGTKVLAEAALAAGVERFILVSTDKAVRPTSVMGATKRMAEMVIQDLQTRASETLFSMVRFGNVLGSSGSVLPLFQAQIDAGGPVTVTHPEVTRYFMTVAEASRLVLLAGSYARGGDVFLLDMGEPQKIIDIARRMIELSGRTVQDEWTGKGDIAIDIVGLRPGEKLYEELLIDHEGTRETAHDKILWAEEERLSEFEMAMAVKELSDAIETSNPSAVRNVIARCVSGYAPQADARDWASTA